MGAYRTSHLLVDVLRMGDGRDAKRAKAAKKSAKLALASAKGIARERPESLRWSGRAMALRGKPERALDLYGRAVDEAQRLGAIPELSRVCAELAGLIGEDAKYRELTAAQWQTRAVQGFAAIGLMREAEALGWLRRAEPATRGAESAKPRPMSGNGK